MSPEYWGPAIWQLFHTLAQKIKADNYHIIRNDLINYILDICKLLPCPDCSSHAMQFWKKINFSTLKQPIDLQKALYVFHNSVNRRKDKSLFPYDKLHIYANYPIIPVYNNFIRVFHTRGNMKLLAESFQRNRLIFKFKNWLTNNIHHFEK